MPSTQNCRASVSDADPFRRRFTETPYNKRRQIAGRWRFTEPPYKNGPCFGDGLPRGICRASVSDADPFRRRFTEPPYKNGPCISDGLPRGIVGRLCQTPILWDGVSQKRPTTDAGSCEGGVSQKRPTKIQRHQRRASSPNCRASVSDADPFRRRFTETPYNRRRIVRKWPRLRFPDTHNPKC